MSSVEILTTNHGIASHSGNYLCLHQVRNGNAFAVNSFHQHPLVGDGYLIQNVGTAHSLRTVATEVVTICIPESLIQNERFAECLTPRDFQLDRAVSNLLIYSRGDRNRFAMDIIDALIAARDTSNQNFYLRERSNRNANKESTMKLAREFILSKLADPFGVTDVANHLSLSVFHFHRQFTEWHGMTPGRYILQEKIRRACRRLVLRNDPVSQVALDCGYFSPTSFVTTFRSVTGLTPSGFRSKQGILRSDLMFYDGIS
jgi:AraC-like DNA-binding protein